MARFTNQKIWRGIAGIAATLSFLVCLTTLRAQTQTNSNTDGNTSQLQELTQPATENRGTNMNTSQMTARERMFVPAANNRKLEPLIGKWNVQFTFRESEKATPVVSRDITCTRRWLSNTLYMLDETQGTLNAKPYYRAGILGYNNLDQQYEWITVDNVGPGLMIYHDYSGATDDASNVINLHGRFTEAGFGKELIGAQRKIRNVFRIESNDRHVIELWITRPASKEFREVEMVFTRQK